MQQPAASAASPDWRARLRDPATGVNVLAAVALLGLLWAARAFVVPVLTSMLLAVLLWPLLRRWRFSWPSSCC